MNAVGFPVVEEFWHGMYLRKEGISIDYKICASVNLVVFIFQIPKVKFFLLLSSPILGEGYTILERNSLEV